ncbi:MAG: ABC transporter permease [Candidatus Asgardarchaeum californiense]|nr:MAG: ABC transporter permease [Candidatus Asgardarchaeum californiense]
MKQRLTKVTNIIPILAVIIIWETVVRLGFVPSYFLPSFSQVMCSFITLVLNGELVYSFYRSLLRVIIGLSLGVSTGVILGIAMGYNRIVENTLNPIFYLLYPIPALGWLPLLLIWIGISDLLPITLIFLCSFFPLLYNTLTGVKSVDKQLVMVAKTLGASDIQILVEIVIPLAVPNIFTGLRLEAGMAWRTVLAAEMVAIPIGLGALAMKAQSLLLIDVIIDVLIVLSLVCLISEKIIEFLEKKLTKDWL